MDVEKWTKRPPSGEEGDEDDDDDEDEEHFDPTFLEEVRRSSEKRLRDRSRGEGGEEADDAVGILKKHHQVGENWWRNVPKKIGIDFSLLL